MIKLLKDKYTDIYSWVDHFWWKNQVDILLFIGFILLCIITTVSYGKS